MIKRHLFALGGLLLVAFAFQFVIEMQRPWLNNTLVFSGSSPDAVFRRALMLTVSIGFLRNFISFGAGALILKKRVFVPGIGLFFFVLLAFAGYAWLGSDTLNQRHVIADGLYALWPVIAAEFFGVVAGLASGLWLANRRALGHDAL